MSLTKAIEAGNIKFLEQLIHDNDVGILIEPDVYGQYPLHYASVHGKLDIVTLLVEEAGADVNCRTHTGTTPAHYAARSNRVAILKYLMSKGADITARDAHSWTPLHYAALAGYADTVEIIINENNNSPDGKPKMDIDMQELHGYTPLHLACFNGFTDVAVALIDAGADFSKLGGGKERTKAEYPLRMLPLKAKDPLSLDDSLLRLQKAVHSSCNKLHKNFFTYLYEQKNFCDFELTFGEESIQTHKAVLFSRVGFFRDFDFDKSGGKYAVPDKFTKEAFEYFLEWCYTGSIHSLVDEERETEITTAHIPIIVNLIDIAEFYCGEEADCSGLPELCISGLSRGLTAEIVDTLIHALISAKETSEWIDKLCIVAVEGLLSLKDTTFNKKAYEEIAKFSKRRIKVIVKGLKPLLTNKPPELSSLRFENIVAPPPPPPLFDELLGDDDANSGNNVNTPQEKADDPLVAEEREKKLHQSKSLVPNVFVLEMSSACPQKLKKYMRDTNEMESFQKVLPFLLSTRNSKVCLGMIEKMRSAPDSSWFINPVPDNQDYAPGYYKVIKHPMDLTTLKVNTMYLLIF